MHPTRRTLLGWLAAGTGLTAHDLAAQTGPASRLAAAGGAPNDPAGHPSAVHGRDPLQPVDPRRRLQFPRDFGAHPDTRTEWWYVTGELSEAQATASPAHPTGLAPLGFQITFFRSRVDTVPADHPSPLAARELVLAHAALSDVPRQRLWHDQRLARAVLSQAGASRSDTRAWIGPWVLQREPGPVGHADERYAARIDARDFSLDLKLKPEALPLLQGQAGFSRKGPDPRHASHYYTRPQLQVSGHVTHAGRRFAVRGRAWLDHEWSEALLAPDAVGWDWIGMNLDDGGALTAFQLRRADGGALWAGGSHRAANGRVVAFGPDQVRFEPLRHWTSPRTGARYPVQWQVSTPAGRHRVTARFDAQELDSRASGSPTYWEGLSALTDASGQTLGSGYLEMTGYADKLSF